jgi:hypothetical protein
MSFKISEKKMKRKDDRVECTCTSNILVKKILEEYTDELLLKPPIPWRDGLELLSDDENNPTRDEFEGKHVFTICEVLDYLKLRLNGPSTIESTVEHGANVIHHGVGEYIESTDRHGQREFHRCDLEKFILPMRECPPNLVHPITSNLLDPPFL